MNQNTITINTPIGYIAITIENKKIISIKLNAHKKEFAKTSFEKNVVKQIQAYFKDPNFKFNLPLKLNSASFQKKVWHAIQKISVGKTITYGDLAKQLKSSPRAIGNACRQNPIPLIIPCHRVVSKKGLGGFMGKTKGKTVSIKQYLLLYEKNSNNLEKTN